MRLPSVMIIAIALTSPHLALTATKAETITYDRNDRHPYGQRNPTAPPETTQFDFLIGEHSCNDEFIELDGKTEHLKSRWRGEYVLNGLAIQDHYWSDRFSATNIRIFDAAETQWIVSYFRLPNFRSGLWKGRASDNRIVLRQSFEREGAIVESTLTFKNISQNGFDWVSEYVSGTKRHVSWTSNCRRIENEE